MLEKLFCYVIKSASTIGIGATDKQMISISNDHDFHLKEIRTSGTTNVRASLANANGEQWSNQSLNLGLVGSGFNGLRLMDREMIIPANTQIETVFDNQTGAGITAAQEIQLWGFKIPRVM